jgi:PKD repeat protein
VLTYSASNLPVGATFVPATRQFTWSPAYNQLGKYTVTFRVSDGTLSTSRNVTFTAIKVNFAPYFTLGNLTTLTYNEGMSIRVNINAADWNQDAITYSAKNLPKGATVDSATHSFSWTPGYDQAGTYTITLIVSDGKLQNSKVLRIIVNDVDNAPVFKPVHVPDNQNEVNHAPVLLSIADMTIDEGKLLTVVVNATSSEGKNLIYSATDLPTGATFNPASHSLSWTPGYDQAGSYTITFTVSEGMLKDSKSLHIIVKDSLTTTQQTTKTYIKLS